MEAAVEPRNQDPQSTNEINGRTRTRTEEKDGGFSAIGGGLVEEELGEGLCRFENAIEAAATRPAKPLTSFSDDALAPPAPAPPATPPGGLV